MSIRKRSEELLKETVSFQSNSWSKIAGNITVKETLEMIKNGKYLTEINNLRSYLENGDRDSYDQNKKRLPSVTFSATFNLNRNRNSISVYNNLLVLDIDKLSKEMITDLEAKFIDDPYIISFWESPSKDGIKGLVYLNYGEEFSNIDVNSKHTYAFRKVSEYMSHKYKIEIDNSGSDITRLCFFSYDANLIIREFYEPFLINYSSNDFKYIPNKTTRPNYKYSVYPSRDQLFNPKERNSQKNRNTIVSIIRYLTKRSLSITSSYNNWYQVAYSIVNTFTHEIGVKYFLALCKLDKDKFDKHNCISMLDYCYANTQGGFTFATIVFFAKQVGYKEEKVA